MRGHFLKPLLSLMISVLLFVSLLTSFIWYTQENNNVQPKRSRPLKKSAPQSSASCKDCRETINKVLELYSKTWTKEETSFQKFRLQLSTKCHGFEKATITQTNTPVGTKLVYDGERKRALQVNPELFSTFYKVGASFLKSNMAYMCCCRERGILANSSCGKVIDSADFVIRCNLPPLSNGYEEHVGIKTDLVTANPSILLEKFGALMGRRRQFVESLRSYGHSLLLLPAFSFGRNTPVSLRAFYTLEDFESPIRPIFFNPGYLQSLALFWRSQGLRAVRLSTGIIMTSLALELCDNVQLYGFWPFDVHPHSFQTLTNHYYDDRKTKTKFHAMPDEFNHLLRLHNQGVLKLHLGDCTAEGK